jgi:peptide/nickel transport system ATP-binding protein
VSAPLLEVTSLHTSFRTRGRVARAVDGVSFTIAPEETVGLVGESGCGKSVTALSIMRLIRPPGVIAPESRITFESRELFALPEVEMRGIRGRRLAMVFQEPMASLNPVLRIGAQVAEVARVHTGASRTEAWALAVEALSAVGFPDPARRAHDYPHLLSGGMRQRVVIAMAILLQPALLIADEPTTALDVTTQAQILERLAALQAAMAMSVLLITHDLGIVAERAQRVIVMYAGQIVEEAPVRELFAAPHHPYTTALLAAVPRLGARRDRLETIPGQVPSAEAWPTGCRFRERCPSAFDRCATEPPLYRIGSGHRSRCHLDAPGGAA